MPFFPLTWSDGFSIELFARILGPLSTFWGSSSSWMEQCLSSLRVKELICQAPRVLDEHSWSVLATVQSLAEPLIHWIGAIWAPERSLGVEESGFFGIRLKCAFWLNASTVNEFLPFLSPLSILVKTIELCKLGLRIRLSCLLLLNDLFRNPRYLRLKTESFGLFPQVLNPLRVYLFLYSFSIFHKEVFWFLIIHTFHQLWDRIDLGLEAVFFKLSLILLWSGSLNMISFLFFSSHSSFVKELSIVASFVSAALSFT